MLKIGRYPRFSTRPEITQDNNHPLVLIMKTHTTSDNYISIEKTEFEFMCDPNNNHGRKTPLESFYSLCPQTSMFQVNQKEQM